MVPTHLAIRPYLSLTERLWSLPATCAFSTRLPFPAARDRLVEMQSRFLGGDGSVSKQDIDALMDEINGLKGALRRRLLM